MVSVSQLAWGLWKNRQHRFDMTSSVTREVLISLSNGNVTVFRGQEFEFRYDLMHPYLAACWVTKYVGSSEVSRQRLLEKEIWYLSPSEQRLVFDFVAALTSGTRQFEDLITFASEDAQMRQSLLVALVEHSNSRRYKWAVGEPGAAEHGGNEPGDDAKQYPEVDGPCGKRDSWTIPLQSTWSDRALT